MGRRRKTPFARSSVLEMHEKDLFEWSDRWPIEPFNPGADGRVPAVALSMSPRFCVRSRSSRETQSCAHSPFWSTSTFLFCPLRGIAECKGPCRGQLQHEASCLSFFPDCDVISCLSKK